MAWSTQGSSLRPLLLSYLKISADNAEVMGDVKSVQDYDNIEIDLNELQNWSSIWLMNFNLTKCRAIKIENVEEGLIISNIL